MGRYYSGDIEGKFWFAVQPSNSADRFGVMGYIPDYLDYNYTEEDKPKKWRSGRQLILKNIV